MTRYPRYKNSGVTWLGDIPEGWEVRKIFGLFTENTKKNRHFVVRHAMQFNYGRLIDKNENFDVEDAKDIYSKYTLLKKKDIVINGLNLNYDLVSQRIAIAPKDGIVTSAYIIITARPSICPEYYCYLFKGMDSKKIFHGMGCGVRLTLAFKELRNQEVPLPPLPEQEAIVRYLDETIGKIDKAIAAEERLIELLQERKQIIINEAVGGDLSRAEAQRGRGWVVKPFKSLFSTCNGLTITKADLSEEGCAVLSYGQIHSKKNNGIRVNPELVRHVPESFAKAKSLAHKGDFLFADTSEDLEGCGNCIFIDMEEPIYAGAHVILAKANHSENGYYLAYEFASVNWRSQLRMKVNGVKVFSVTQTILNSVSVALPPLPEQEAIVKYLDEETGKIDRAIDVKRRQIALLRERREIIIDEVVTGKVKVA